VKIYEKLKGASMEEESPLSKRGASPFQAASAFLFFGLSMFLAPYYDQRVARMLKAKLVSVRTRARKSPKR
jgi:hypothetical protein